MVYRLFPHVVTDKHYILKLDGSFWILFIIIGNLHSYLASQDFYNTLFSIALFIFFKGGISHAIVLNSVIHVQHPQVVKTTV